MKKEKLMIIDANALVHRAFHALPPLSSQKGELTNAVYGFTSLLIKALNDIKPDYVVACFDLPEPTFRHKEFDEYKAHRDKTPEDLIPQFKKVKEVLSVFGISIFEKPGFEADDLLGTISLLSKKQNPNIQNIILTGDLDTLQLIDDNTVVYTLKKGISDIVIYDKNAVLDRYGLFPYQMTDFKGLKGDPSDNIPGVPGIGEKTATSLLKEYKTIEGVYENIGLIKKSLAEKLQEYKDQAFFSKKIATIIRDVKIDFNLNDVRFGNYDKGAVSELFKALNFFTLIPRINGFVDSNKEKNTKTISIKDVSGHDIKKIKNIKSVAVSFFGDFVFFCLDKKEILKAKINEVKNILEDESIKKTGYNLKLDINFLKRKGINLAGIYFDVMIASYLLSPGLRKYEIKKMVFDHLKDDSFFDDDIKKYSYFCLLLKDVLEDKLKKDGLLDIFYNIEMKIVPILAQMEFFGIKVDVSLLKEFSFELEKKIKNLEKKIHRYTGKNININSPLQLGPILFEKLNVQKDAKLKKTKTGAYTTSESELEKYKDNHPVIALILEYRELTKLKSTYVDAMLKIADKKTHKIHTTYNQAGTSTGRLSSSDPNLQNIPQKGEFAEKIRNAFVSSDGFSFLAYDYSQIELRIVAHLSGDEKMISIFKNGGDIHTNTAMEINGVKESEVTKEMRRIAKVLNFGILFGMGIKGVAEASGISMQEAKKFINTYFEAFPKVAEFIDKSIKDAKKNGYVKTELGRKRWLPDINSKNWILRNSAERMAQNMPVQGLEADILKLAMINIQKEFFEYKDNIKMILQVHDELVFEVKDDIINSVKDKIKKVMEESYNLKVPILVDLSIGKRWGSMKIEG